VSPFLSVCKCAAITWLSIGRTLIHSASATALV
jgi:hypothetical protein